MNDSRKTLALVIVLLCAIALALLARDLGGGAGGGQPPPPSEQPPAAPSNLRVTSTTKTVAHIAWDDKSNNESGFEIESEGKQNPKTGPNETQWEISGLACGKAYNFRVRAFNAAGNSPWSNQVTAQTLACDSGGQQPPPVPRNCRASPSGTGIYISWDEPPFPRTWNGFRVYRRGAAEPVKTFDNATVVAGPIENLTPNTTYHLDVRAYNSAGESPADACAVDVTTK